MVIHAAMNNIKCIIIVANIQNFSDINKKYFKSLFISHILKYFTIFDPMKKLLILLILIALVIFILGGCRKESHYCYSLDVWVAGNGLIRVDYFADLPGYTLLIGCEPGLTTGNAMEVKYEPDRKSGGYALTRICSPEYIRVISAAGTEEIKI